MTEATSLTLIDVEQYERDVRLRMPFRFGVVTLTEAPQTYVRARIKTADGREGWGMSADLLAPKWFDKSPDLTNEENFEQLRRAVAIAGRAYLAQHDPLTAFGLHAACAGEIAATAGPAGLPPLASAFGPACLDRAILDALLRLEGVSLFEAVRRNLIGLDAALTPDLAAFDLPGFLGSLRPAPHIAARHTIGLVDPIRGADIAPQDRVGDGLPETLEEVVRDYGVTHFKLKVSGDLDADLKRLRRIAGVLDERPGYRATLDGNEQYADVDGIVALWSAIEADPALERLRAAILFVEQPITRARALQADVGLSPAASPPRSTNPMARSMPSRRPAPSAMPASPRNPARGSTSHFSTARGARCGTPRPGSSGSSCRRRT